MNLHSTTGTEPERLTLPAADPTGVLLTHAPNEASPLTAEVRGWFVVSGGITLG
ncbi:hypothetical protein Intca_0347 [Intrasporangium calvum DSM 43043]|uniref:Uncharacterized protein n=1 Tax=Intrasporangium calvum (strain ATCC 23552 / DSM 43043 / JCM 3097 / NBRC 12989 / NCIMB 10167 / NRRL B-3866 / 7 KIP) TaxID=710696 RepID=E6S7K1_INTC7|nr:hypothetical protein Intca_0347 [Intrasporangium calvum DSM 43043]